MRRSTLALLLVPASAALLVAACGGDDSTTAPPADAGADDATTADASPDTGADAGGDAASDATSDVPDAPTDGPRTLDGALCNGAAFTVTKIDPQFAWTGAKTAITITGTGFVATPTVYLEGKVDGGATIVPVPHAAFVSQTSIAAQIPSGVAPGTYDVYVVNPDTCAESLAGALRVVANAPPSILSVEPSTGTTQTDVPVVVKGCHFPQNLTIATVDSTGAVVQQNVSGAPSCTGANDARCDNTPVCTANATILTQTKTMAPGAYVVRATNPTDNTYGDYASFVVTNPSGKLTGNWANAPALVTGRRALQSVAGRIDAANRFLYAVGGEDATGAVLGTIEVAPLDKYGQTGKWFVQRNKLNTARSGHMLVRQGQYLWAIGGNTATNGSGGNAPTGTPIGSIERAKILDTTTAPVLTDPPTVSVAAGTLPKGTYYYKVAAFMPAGDADNPNGETLPSDEVVATLTANGQVSLSWTAVATATKYRVYRSPAANGTSQSEVLLADNVSGTSYVDDGSATPTNGVSPLGLGSTGVWIAQTTALVHPRMNAAAAIAPDPTGALHVYALGGFGSCTGVGANAEMNCYEVSTITADGSAIGATFTPDALHTMQKARQRFGAQAMTAANGPSDFVSKAGANTAFLLLSGGHGISSTGNTVEYSVVGAGGTLGNFALTTGYANERDGSQFQIVNGYAYSFLGGTVGAYKATSDLSTTPILTATTIDFGSWSNAGSNMNNSVGRFGLALESAFFYVIGGTSNDTDALTTVYQIIY